MEVKYKRHSKKSDKETQSPVLKVFKEMIQRENNHPDKANPKEKQENRKRKQSSGSKMKSDHHMQKSHDSSSSERHKRNIQYKVALQEQKNIEYDQCRSQSMPFQGDKKESWWFWDTQKKPSIDTKSHVSCALKKVISSEYTCMACLGVFFLMSVIIAFLVVFKTVPSNKEDKVIIKKPCRMNSELLKKKIDMLQTGRGYDDDTSLKGADERKPWDDVASRRFDGLSRLVGNGYGEDGYRDLNALGDSILQSGGELSSFLDPEKLNEGLSSERLRNFYKKLIQTDAQIHNMKKSFNDVSGVTTSYSNQFNIMSDRKKRSLRLANARSLINTDPKKSINLSPDSDIDVAKFSLYFPPYLATNTTMQKTKRFANSSKEPTGFVIEKKQIVVEYKPNDKTRKVAKCSHVPKDSKSHEKQMKHPFYKNTQRLDELLDQLLDRNLPEMMVDPFSVERLFKNKEETVKESSSNILSEKPDQPTYVLKTSTPEAPNKSAIVPFKPISRIDDDLFNYISKKKQSKLATTTYSPYFNVLLSVSTIVNPGYKKTERKSMSSPLQTRHHIRKLMQINEEDGNNLGYEDVNEVLADETETHDDKENGHEIRKRKDEDRIDDLKHLNNPLNAKSFGGIHNPNWKGPMPLYPDELISMIKQAALENMYSVNKAKTPVNNKDVSPEIGSLESSLNDMEYIENYSDNKFNNLVKVAQAYSDYGVLDEKKESMSTEKNPIVDVKSTDRKVKLSINKAKSLGQSIFDRFKKGSEGIRFEMRPTSSPREDEASFDVFRKLGKHIKFGSPEKVSMDHLQSNFHNLAQSTPDSVNTNLALFSTIHRNMKYGKSMANKQAKENIFSISFGKGNSRSLLSIDETSEEDHETDLSPKETNKLRDDNTHNTNAVNTLKYSNSLDRILTNTTERITINNKSSNMTTIMDLSDFFIMVSNWFNTLAMYDINYKPNVTDRNNSNINKFTAQKSQKAVVNNETTNVMYPNYDSDMIENIGHRSRVLMGIDDATYFSTKGMDGKSCTPTDNEASKLSTVAITTVSKSNDSSIPTESDLNIATILDKSVKIDGNRSIVKRNADDNNLIFWNGIYDDEYGVKMDSLDNAVGDKQYPKSVDFVKKSGTWIQNKMKNFANNFRKKDKLNIGDVTKERISRGAGYLWADGYPKYQYKKFRKRSARVEKEEADDEMTSFESLTAKMKVVCKEAAKAVQQTQNIKIRQDEKEDTMTTSLMQQLVRLMTDLVDFQVQQKTCIKLPPDLQQFLEWLTSANSEKIDAKNQEMGGREDNIELPPDTEFSVEKEEMYPDSRSDCIGTLHAVEDLMQQYDEMNDDEKSKMTGVREYLENQLQFLHKRLSSYGDYKIPNTYDYKDIPLRFRRDLPSTSKDKTDRHKNRIYRNRFKRRFLKNFGKKHTRTTSSIYDGYSTDEIKRANDGNLSESNKGSSDLHGKEVNKTINKNEKRNLKDVYYKAIADAKKYTTPNNGYEKKADGFVNAQVVRIDK